MSKIKEYSGYVNWFYSNEIEGVSKDCLYLHLRQSEISFNCSGRITKKIILKALTNQIREECEEEGRRRESPNKNIIIQGYEVAEEEWYDEDKIWKTKCYKIRVN